MTKTKDFRLFAVTRPYYKQFGTVLSYDLDKGLSERWYFCTITLYDNTIGTKAYKDSPNDDTVFESYVKRTLAHEIGHSLKLAHTPVSDEDATHFNLTTTEDGGGTDRINIPLSGDRSIMEGSSTSLAQSLESPTAYDKQELIAKWGN